ncbi:hypothetical protein, partial [Escherichia coli]|uniref:hypothetical protein n=1 Tax=Escherichia coli TaxID=562 RepID=UPI0032DBC587
IRVSFPSSSAASPIINNHFHSTLLSKMQNTFTKTHTIAKYLIFIPILIPEECSFHGGWKEIDVKTERFPSIVL